MSSIPPVDSQGSDASFFEGASVLVTGGAGFIGSHLVEHLLAAGARVDVLDDLSTGRHANLPAHPRLRLIRASILDRTVLAAVGRVDLVFHLAAVVGMRLARDEGERAWRVAEEGTRNVVACTAGARLVLLSSSAVYCHTGSAPVREPAAADEATLLAFDGGQPGYASGKCRLEALGREAAARGREVLAVRPFNVVGPRQSARYGMVLPRFVRSAVAERPLTVYGTGAQSRSFADVRTFVRTLVRLAAEPRSWTLPGGAVNVGVARSTRIGELARMVVEEAGSPSPIECVPYERVFPGHRDVEARVPDTALCESLVGPVAWPATREIVREVVARARCGAA